MGLLDAIFGNYSKKEINKITRTVDKIEALAEKFEAMSEDEMRGYTSILKDRLRKGETLDDI